MRKKNSPDFAISKSRSWAWKYHWGFKRWEHYQEEGGGTEWVGLVAFQVAKPPESCKNLLCETFEKKACLARLPEPDLGFGGAGREGGGGLTEETAGGSAASDWVGGGEKL